MYFLKNLLENSRTRVDLELLMSFPSHQRAKLSRFAPVGDTKVSRQPDYWLPADCRRTQVCGRHPPQKSPKLFENFPSLIRLLGES